LKTRRSCWQKNHRAPASSPVLPSVVTLGAVAALASVTAIADEWPLVLGDYWEVSGIKIKDGGGFQYPDRVGPQRPDLSGNAELHLLDTGHFALEDKGGDIARLMLNFLERKLPGSAE